MLRELKTLKIRTILFDWRSLITFVNFIHATIHIFVRTCPSMTGVHLIFFLIHNYTSSSESASVSKYTRWAFRDVSNPFGNTISI